ncbi:MAG: 30S ribosomal protein S20 [Pseudomonadota bacterium]
MANTQSARKRVRQTHTRTVINRNRTSRIRTYLRQVEDAISSGDYSRAREALSAAEPELRKGVTRGVLHLNTASRKISRLSRRVKALRPPAA